MELVDGIADCRYLDFFSVVPLQNLVLGKKGVQVVHGPMSFALLLSTFFTSIFTSIPRTDNSISPSPSPIFLPLGDTNRYTQPGKL